MKRKNSIKVNQIKKIKRNYYPVIVCHNEKIPIAVSRCVYKKGMKVSFEHFNEENGKFKKGYEIDLSKYEVGEKVLCPVCNKPVSFILMMFDEEPDIN